jgi:hypothetical protein
MNEERAETRSPRSQRPSQDREQSYPPAGRRWCQCQMELHEIEQLRAVWGISEPWYGGHWARAHAEGRCSA